MIAQLATTAMGFVDAVMAGRVGPRDLAAVALGNSIWVPVFLLMTGTFCWLPRRKSPNAHGAGSHSEIGPIGAPGVVAGPGRAGLIATGHAAQCRTDPALDEGRSTN
jgi:MATE family multidrug resistance protein